MRSAAALRRRVQWFMSDHPRTGWALVILLLLLVSYPFWAGYLAAKVVSRIAEKVRNFMWLLGAVRMKAAIHHTSTHLVTTYLTVHRSPE